MSLSQDRNTSYKSGDLLQVPVGGSETIYAGALVTLDDNGYACAGGDSSGHIIGGVATEKVDNSGGSDGDKSVVLNRRGSFRFELASAYAVGQEAVGGKAYVVDDEKVGDASEVSNSVLAGVIEKVESDGTAWVAIDEAVRQGRDWSLATTTTA